jgi:hypothetical protein
VNRRVIAVPEFETYVAALGDSPEVRELVKAMISFVERQPFNAPEIPGLTARVIKSRSYGKYPSLKLVYRVEDDVIYLYSIAPYDELAGE